MQDILIRIEARDFNAWLAVHNEHVADRRSYGITDGPVYRDLADPNAALFHIRVESIDQAMGWFRSDKFREATNRATVVGRAFYLAQKQEMSAAGRS